MATDLNILIVDDRPDTVLFLTEFLISRQHHVAIVGNGKEALAAIVRRRTASPFDLIVCELSVPGMDGLALLRELRRRQEPVELAICTSYAHLHPGLPQEAEQLRLLAVLDKPTDLKRVDELLIRVAWDKRGAPAPGAGEKSKDQPFFGTSRIVRAEDVKTTSLERPPSQPGSGPERRADAPVAASAPVPETVSPFDALDAATGDAPHPPTRSGVRPPTGGTLRDASSNAPALAADGTYRTGSGRQVKPPSAIPVAPEMVNVPKPGAHDLPAKPLAPVTTRMRRSITGTERIVRPSIAADGTAESSRAVACAICRKAFKVGIRAQPYCVVCVHCGQLNSIDPLLG